MAAIPAPGEAVWLPEGEAAYGQTNTGSRRVAKASLLGGLTLAIYLRARFKQEYLRQIEDTLGFQNLGWEKKLQNRPPHFSEGKMYGALWGILFVGDLLLGIISLFGLS